MFDPLIMNSVVRSDPNFFYFGKFSCSDTVLFPRIKKKGGYHAYSQTEGIS